MTEQVHTPRTLDQLGDGTNKVFNFTFPSSGQSQFRVFIADVGSLHTAVEITDFTSLANNSNTGGTITLGGTVDAPTSTQTVNVFRNTRIDL